MSVSWTTLKALFEEAIGDTSQAFFDDATQVRMVNRSLNRMAEAAEYYDYEVTGDTVADTAVYAISPLFNVWRVEVEDEALHKTTTHELRRMARDWQTVTGTPRYWYDDEVQAAAVKKIGMWPVPNDALGYRIYGHSRPTQSSDSNPGYAVHAPQWVVYSVLFGMLEQAFRADTMIRNDATADIFGMMFEDALFRLRVRSFSKLNKIWTCGSQKTAPVISFWDTLEEVDGT